MLPSVKKVVMCGPATYVDNGNFTVTSVDTMGFDYCVIDIVIGFTDIALSALYLQDSEESGANFANVSGGIYGTDNNDTGSASTLAASTADNTVISYWVDCRARKRYLTIVGTAGNGTSGTTVAVLATLSRASAGPRTAAQAGYGQRIIV